MRSVVSLFSGDVQTEHTCIPVRDILHGAFLCSAPVRHRGRTLRPETHVSLILEHVHVKLIIRRLDATLWDTKPPVYIRWRDPMILDITINGYDM